MSNIKAFLLAAIISLGICNIVFASNFPNTNLNNDNIENFYDFAMFANNWQQTGAGLLGDFDDSNTVDIDDLMMFSWFWLSHFSEYQQCQGTGTDLDDDGLIAFEDFAKFAENWLSTGTGLIGDFDTSNSVDCNDLSVFADCWLKGSRPESIWEQFKSALRNDDLDMALTFIADSAKEQYIDALTQLRPYFQNMVNGMGELILISIDSDRAKYEMLHDEGGGVVSSFPVYFSKNEKGEWKIYCF
jgi:hypothetical protein